MPPDSTQLQRVLADDEYRLFNQRDLRSLDEFSSLRRLSPRRSAMFSADAPEGHEIRVRYPLEGAKCVRRLGDGPAELAADGSLGHERSGSR